MKEREGKRNKDEAFSHEKLDHNDIQIKETREKEDWK